MKEIIPAILAADTKELKHTLKNLKGLTPWVHIDIMDGKFVPHESIAVSELGNTAHNFKLEMHLMVEKPENYFSDCDSIKAERVIFHAEASKNIGKTLKSANAFAYERGVALNPETPVAVLHDYINEINEVLVMGVVPGKQAQGFIASALSKVKEIKKLMPSLMVGVDGGIKLSNSASIARTGVDRCVIGSAIVKTDDYKRAIDEFREELSTI